jgi:hypothetical protein
MNINLQMEALIRTATKNYEKTIPASSEESLAFILETLTPNMIASKIGQAKSNIAFETSFGFKINNKVSLDGFQEKIYLHLVDILPEGYTPHVRLIHDLGFTVVAISIFWGGKEYHFDRNNISAYD